MAEFTELFNHIIPFLFTIHTSPVQDIFRSTVFVLHNVGISCVYCKTIQGLLFSNIITDVSESNREHKALVKKYTLIKFHTFPFCHSALFTVTINVGHYELSHPSILSIIVCFTNVVLPPAAQSQYNRFRLSFRVKF